MICGLGGFDDVFCGGDFIVGCWCVGYIGVRGKECVNDLSV